MGAGLALVIAAGLVVVAGVAVLVLRNAREHPKAPPEDGHQLSGRYLAQGMGIGLSIGMGLGLALGVAIDNISLGVALGPALGASLGVAIGSGLQERAGVIPEPDEPTRRRRMLIALVIGVACLMLLVAYFIARGLAG